MCKWIAQAEDEGIGFPTRIVYAGYERPLLLDVEKRVLDVHKAYEAFRSTHTSTTNALTAWSLHIHTCARMIDEYDPPACKRGALKAFRQRIAEEGNIHENAPVIRTINRQMDKLSDAEVTSLVAMTKSEVRTKLIDLYLELEDAEIDAISGLLKPQAAGVASTSTPASSDMSSLAPPSAQKKLPGTVDAATMGSPPPLQPEIDVPKKKKAGAKSAKKDDKDEIDRAEVEKLRRARVETLSGRLYPSADTTIDDDGLLVTVVGGDRALHAALQSFRNLSTPAQDRTMRPEEIFYKTCFGKCEQNVLALANAAQYGNQSAANLARARNNVRELRLPEGRREASQRSAARLDGAGLRGARVDGAPLPTGPT